MFGCGMTAQPLPKAVAEYIARLGMKVEVLDSVRVGSEKQKQRISNSFQCHVSHMNWSGLNHAMTAAISNL